MDYFAAKAGDSTVMLQKIKIFYKCQLDCKELMDYFTNLLNGTFFRNME